MKIQSNIKIIAENIKNNLLLLKDKEYLLRQVSFDVLDMITKRIHVDGKAADGSQIGTYSEEYMKVRTGNFANADRFSRGAKTGQNKNAGTFTSRSSQAGTPRPKYNRSSDTKIIVSLTRQLENDWSVVAIANGYGIGFLNQFNTQKMLWVEEQKEKKIAALTTEEQDFVIEQVNIKVADALAGKA